MAASLPLFSASTPGACGPCERISLLAGVAVRLLCMHSTACASERNWSAWGQLHTKTALERARKLIYVRFNSKQFTEDTLEASLQPLKDENE
eukprot:1159777-Pelagomonas_calceolata.AAC.3